MDICVLFKMEIFMGLKKLSLLFFLVCMMFQALAGKRNLSFDFGSSGKTPNRIWSFFNYFRRLPSFLLSDFKAKCIARSMLQEYKTGQICPIINRYFFELNDATARKIGPKLAEFRKYEGDRLNLVKEVYQIVGYAWKP